MKKREICGGKAYFCIFIMTYKDTYIYKILFASA